MKNWKGWTMSEIPSKEYIIEEVLSMSNSRYNLDYIVLDISTLYLYRPSTSSMLYEIIGLDIVTAEVDTLDMLVMEFLLNYYSALSVEYHTEIITTILVNDIISMINEKFRYGLYEIDFVKSPELMRYLDELNNHYRSLLNKYTSGMVNVMHINASLGLEYLDKFYTVKENTIYFNDLTSRMQTVLAIRTVKDV